MKKFSEYLLESIVNKTIKDLEDKLKETSDADMRLVIQKKIQQAKLSKK